MLQLFRNLIIALMVTLGLGTAHAANESGMHNALAQWVSASTKNRVSIDTATQYVRAAYKAADKWNIDPLLLLSFMKAESNYQAKAGNSYGARGLMQVVPRYHREKIEKRNILDYKTNIDVGAEILNEYLQLHKENFHVAMKRYSGGAGKAYKARIQATYKELKDVAIGWKMDNQAPIIAEHSFTKPRRYGESIAQYQEAAHRARVVASAQHDVIYVAYVESLMR